MTITKTCTQHVRVLEILLCPSVLFGYNDSIIAIPLEKRKINKKTLSFQGLYLSLNEKTVLTPNQLNSNTTMCLDGFDQGLLHVTVVKYYVQNDIEHAVVRISTNPGETQKKVTEIVRDQLSVFAFQYSFETE